MDGTAMVLKVGEIPAWTQLLWHSPTTNGYLGDVPAPDWRGRPISIAHTSAKDTQSGADSDKRSMVLLDESGRHGHCYANGRRQIGPGSDRHI
ncbi:hypothetical protein Zmor_013113 [Zophobas morio]|uniref:Uncharacterized protein n=1 Tax=Zophobas morio TaxID=2755281 RepID=A0AA38MEC8_9CUCU|nr:hypothetical protein Zmor_013113 [Zophobas morio]